MKVTKLLLSFDFKLGKHPVFEEKKRRQWDDLLLTTILHESVFYKSAKIIILLLQYNIIITILYMFESLFHLKRYKLYTIRRLFSKWLSL